MNWLRQKIDENRKFFRVLSLAIICNLIIIGLFAMISYSVKDITVTVNGKTAQYKTIRNSVNDMLRGWDVKLDEKDVVNLDKDEMLKDGDDVKIDLYDVYKETVSEATDFDTETEYTSDLLEGESKVTTEGVKGEDRVTYEVVTLGGIEQSRKEIGRKTISKPVTEVIAEGTAVSYNGVKYTQTSISNSESYSSKGFTDIERSKAISPFSA